jgi:hypothetical protein
MGRPVSARSPIRSNKTIVAIGDRWYLRFWERKNVGGVLERKRVSRVLGAITTQGKRPPADIQEAAEEHMREVNRGLCLQNELLH